MTLAAAYEFSPVTKKSAGHRLLRASDGDTLVVEQPIRLVSCDTAEKAQYAGRADTAQPKLDLCRSRLKNGFYSSIPGATRDYLIGKLDTGAAGRHISAGIRASAQLVEIRETRLAQADGTMRKVAVLPSGEIIDSYGRMLAYLAPWFEGPPADPVPPEHSPKRRTFNLDMIESGWAAFFPIYPSLPGLEDMRRAVAAAEQAWVHKRGMWQAFGSDLLLGYEYRMCIKLATAADPVAGIAEAFQRICVDLRTLQIVGKFGFDAVPPSYRLWVWEKDLADAKAVLRLQET
jgi:endonuclease YncB( thermonuclease family)